jgi:predicted phage terminase large subunit-like protein
VIGTAWRLGRNPRLKVLDIAYGEALSHERSRQFRQIVTSSFFKWIFPEVCLSKLSGDLIETTAGGSRRSTSLQGAVTGLGADLIVVDDPMKAQAAGSDVQRDATVDAFKGALLSRLDDQKTGQIMVVAQRLNDQDLAGALLETGIYEHFNYPAVAPSDIVIPLGKGRHHKRSAGEALCPERVPLETLEQLRQEMGSARFEAQYQQNPDAIDGGRVDWTRVGRYEVAPERSELDWVIFSLDPAVSEEGSACFSVLTIWAGRGHDRYLLDVCRGRWPTPDLMGKLASWGAQWRPHYVLIEENGVGRPIGQFLIRDGRNSSSWLGRNGTLVRTLSVRDPKEVRFDLCLDLLHSGRVLIPSDAHWLGHYQRELSAHPHASRYDQIDSTSQFLNWARANQRALSYRPGERPSGYDRPQGRPRRR